MVVMNPDQITILYILRYILCEQTIDLLIRSPCALIEGNLSGVVVEERPENGI